MLRIGVLGGGHLGKIHLKCLGNTPFSVIGIYDPDQDKAKQLAEKFGCKLYASSEELILACDALDIVSTTTSHYELAKQAIYHNKHIFIEKPVTSSIKEARDLILLSKDKNLKIQIGHVERFNPAFVSLQKHNLSPMFVEGHRLTSFSSRGADVSVVLDLMIHDLDLILSLVKSKVKNIYANGVSVISDHPDICNARLEFENGCVANLTASRMSIKQMRKLRLFQKDAYISIDFLEKTTQIIQLLDYKEGDEGMTIDTSRGKRLLKIETPIINEFNAIQKEFELFYKAIFEDIEVPV